MCLKYFVGHPTCDHHEYLGSFHCNDRRPCDLDQQHFHYIEDDFLVPLPSNLKNSLQTSESAFACTTCANELRAELDPDEQLVQFYAPTNNIQIKKIESTGPEMLIHYVEADAIDIEIESTETEGSNDPYDYDYKSLSAADEDEWDTPQPGQATETHAAYYELLASMHQDLIQGQLNLPTYFVQYPKTMPPLPPSHWPGAYPVEGWSHYPMPFAAYVQRPSAAPLSYWHGGMPSPLPMPTGATTHSGNTPPQPMPSSAPRDAATPPIPAVLQQRPATPPSTPPLHPLPPCPTPPFIVGTLTDAYLRIEAAKRRHMRGRTRRGRTSQDTLPVRAMALMDFMVNKRRGNHKANKRSRQVQTNTWPSLPCIDEELERNTTAGAGESAGVQEIATATYRFSCRLVTLM